MAKPMTMHGQQGKICFKVKYKRLMLAKMLLRLLLEVLKSSRTKAGNAAAYPVQPQRLWSLNTVAKFVSIIFCTDMFLSDRLFTARVARPFLGYAIRQAWSVTVPEIR
ncbi:hypothetical protein TNCT_174731 [Trichonephila clavata]|uniref:Uncharacterized protein n=1 Tax=Trichonephila clavata TaxID=2740835 RepID=A0A8X6EZV2_TRICU|nr:hypothetical protein TNCT_174731 [Trichonephila clavata]